jgi:hypothetical protein
MSIAAHKLKVKHRVLTNFILMMGAVEFFSVIT